jgi:hypothetical protein
MFARNKVPAGGLLLAGLAAFAYYKYSQMSGEEKEKLMGDLKARGQKIFDEYVPEQYKSFFSKQAASSTGNTAGANSHFGEGSDYSS